LVPNNSITFISLGINKSLGGQGLLNTSTGSLQGHQKATREIRALAEKLLPPVMAYYH
jgi:hypothetical protein